MPPDEFCAPPGEFYAPRDEFRAATNEHKAPRQESITAADEHDGLGDESSGLYLGRTPSPAQISSLADHRRSPAHDSETDRFRRFFARAKCANHDVSEIAPMGAIDPMWSVRLSTSGHSAVDLCAILRLT